MTLLLRLKHIDLSRGFRFQLLFYLLIVPLVDHKRVEFPVNIVDLHLRRCHEAALRVNVAERPVICLTSFLFLVDNFISGWAFLDVIFDVNIVNEIEEHCEVFKGHARNDLTLCSHCFFVWTRFVFVAAPWNAHDLINRTLSAYCVPSELDKLIINAVFGVAAEKLFFASL